MMTAVLWPAALAGPLDGSPLDTWLEVVLIGGALVALIWLHPRFLAHQAVRGAIVLLLVWKAVCGENLTQDGWCLRLESPIPIFINQERVPHAWDVRADWRSETPDCSALMTRGYGSLEHFPVWFYNLPPATLAQPASAADRPPNVTLHLTLEGYLDVEAPGVFQLGVGEDMNVGVEIDDVSVPSERVFRGLPMTAGLHHVSISGTLSGSRWKLLPLWNGANIWTASVATIDEPSDLDLFVRPWGRYVPTTLILSLLAGWLAAVAFRARSLVILGYPIGLSAVPMVLSLLGRPMWLRLIPLGLMAAAALKMPRRLQNQFGAYLTIGVPFLALFVVIGVGDAGRVTFYTSGDDWWMFQRYAYRIFLHGYWLEGGQATFWFQPLYRWIAGSLHMIFGDSSVGELFWDAACVWSGAWFAFHVTKVFAGFRWGVLAASITLSVFTLGPAWYLFGRGLSEISSAGFIYCGALFALRGRNGYWPAALMAGVLATLAFYTRMNNLPMAVAVAAFAFPVRQPARGVWDPRVWRRRAAQPVLLAVWGGLAVGLWLFAARTWYYTNILSVTYGTQADERSVLRMTDSLWVSLTRLAGSVMMVLTMNDPPRLDLRAIPMLIGVLVAVFGAARIGRLASLPLNATALCLAGVFGALVARGTAYPGRFSIHLIPVAVTLTVCAISLFLPDRFANSRRSGFKAELET